MVMVTLSYFLRLWASRTPYGRTDSRVTRTTSALDSFKRQLKTHLFKGAFLWHFVLAFVSIRSIFTIIAYYL